MTWTRATTIVLCLCFLGTVLGATLGLLQGTFVPGYYQAVFADGGLGNLSPVQTGLALGMQQGAASGAVIGLIIVAVLVWREVRLLPERSEISRVAGQRLLVRCLIGGVFSVSIVLVAGVSFVIGGISGQTQIYERRAQLEMQAVHEKLDDRAEFRQIEIARSSDGFVSLHGSVSAQTDHDELFAILQDLFGTERARSLVRLVDVRQTVPGQERD